MHLERVCWVSSVPTSSVVSRLFAWAGALYCALFLAAVVAPYHHDSTPSRCIPIIDRKLSGHALFLETWHALGSWFPRETTTCRCDRVVILPEINAYSGSPATYQRSVHIKVVGHHA